MGTTLAIAHESAGINSIVLARTTPPTFTQERIRKCSDSDGHWVEKLVATGRNSPLAYERERAAEHARGCPVCCFEFFGRLIEV